MSTIVTRKSLAFGAIVALATTAFAGTPAQAAGEINLVPSAGTSYATLSTDAFVLESSFAPGITNQNAQLWFQVKTSTNVSVDVQADSLDASDVSDSNVRVATAGTAGEAADAAFVRYVKASGTALTDRNFLGLKLKGATSVDSADVVVTAFVDSNNDSKLTAGEWSTAKTVSFKTYASVAPVISLDQPNVGDTTATASITLPGLNISQVQSAVVLKFTKDGTAALTGAGGAAAATGITATSADAVDYKATTAAVTAFTSVDTVDVRATIGGQAVGTAVKKTATDRTISKFEATVDVTDNGLANGNVRLNSSYTTTAVTYSNATTPAPLAGVAVVATVTSSVTSFATTAGSEQSVTVNGVKYSTYAALTAAKVALTSDANGKATVTVVPANFAANDTITVTFAAQNLSKAVVATQKAAVLTVSDDATAAVRKIAKNTSATLNYSVKDQFGTSATATNLRLAVTSALKTQYVAVAAGKAVVTVTPTTDSTDSVTIAAALQASTIAADQSVSWAGAAGATNAGNITINVSGVADDFDTAPALAKINNATYNSTSNYKQTIENKDYAATDFPVAAGATLAEISGSATTQGAEVTVSGTGLAFVVGGKVYKDTHTFIAGGSNGDFTVLVAGHKAGVSTVTFKTGAITKTVDVTFDAAVVASLKNTVVSAPSAAQAGRAVTVSATLTDAYGNAIAGKTVKFAVAGVGSLSSSDAVTDASGVATVRLVSSYGEDGDSVVTVSHNGGDNAADTTATVTKDDFTLAKTITFGITDAQIDNVGKRVTAVASFSKGKTVSFYVDGVKKWSKLSASDADVVLNYNLKKGRHTVTMKISGGYITSEVIIVK